MSAPAPHPNLYLVGRGAAGWTLETASGHPIVTGLASRDAARDAAWAAGYREGGTLKDGTEWFGYVPQASTPSLLRESVTAAVGSLIGVVIFAGLLQVLP